MSNSSKYDLEERTFQFAKNVRLIMKNIQSSLTNSDDIKQLIRFSGSIGANYIEANEALSKKDFVYRVRVSRKEAKESTYWLKLLFETNDFKKDKEFEALINESTELKKILSAIIEKSK